ncbi:hypothetical protein [Yoonia sp. 208BN28-4]|uniref:hypothetical protein n=1 Tax=Yoonia sp. 208BN28-4 TaxID=3126505 RepID=UPI0030AB3B4C
MALLPFAAMADGPATGCFERTYSPAHLADHPLQVVSKLRILIWDAPTNDDTFAVIEAQMTRQGHVAATPAAGQRITQGLFCFGPAQGRPAGCAVDCDGGSFEVARQSKQELVIRTSYLMMGDADNCNGATDLAEIPATPVSYRLNAVPMSVCEGLR